MIRSWYKLVLALLLFSSVSVQAQPSYDAIRKAEQTYEAGDFEKAMTEADELLMRDFEFSAADRGRLYLLRARLLYAFDRTGEVGFWLRKALASDATVMLDPLVDPPAMIETMRQLRVQKGVASGMDGDESSGERSFFVGIMPFGIGHMDSGKVKEGTLFLATESLLLIASKALASDSSRSTTTFLGTMSFIGTYSYELLDMMPELMLRDREATESLRFVMNFSPFGAAQAKNGDLGKAFGFAALQSVLLTLGTVTDREDTRTAAYSLLGVSWIFSIIDGFSSYPASSTSGRDGSSFQFVAVPTGSQLHMGLRYRFPE